MYISHLVLAKLKKPSNIQTIQSRTKNFFYGQIIKAMFL